MKKIISIFVSFFVMYTPIFAFAGAAESWTVEKVVYDDVGKSLSYTASRPNAIASNDYIYKAKVGVNAARTGSTAATMIRYGLAGAAIYGIVEAVGWVIENGVVKKIDPTVDSSSSTSPYIWQFGNFNNSDTTCNTNKPKFYTPSPAMSKLEECVKKTYSTVQNFSCSISSPTQYICTYKRDGINGDSTINRSANTSYDPNYKPLYVPVSDTELGEAIQNSPSAPTVIPDIYSPSNPVPRPSPAPDSVETALENANPVPRENPKTDVNNKPNKDTDGDGVPDEYDPTLPSEGFEFELPEFCSWAATVCEWYVRYKEDSELVKEHREKELTFWEKVEEWFDWSKNDSNLPDDESPEISQLPIPELEENAISWAAQCPNDVDIPINLQGVSSTITFSWSPWCQLLSLIKPAIVASAYIGAAFIVLGLRT